ncbi:MAG: AAA family ATPase [Prevotella sp.]|jgi:exonuclease SbcC|nr:AAA family ATPase [Prevotella sp.]
MKILAIRGKNLASLEGEFDIDFTTAPLRSAGIFAITGPTGAGKSTILDALCLALFDDAPRLNKAEQLKIEDDNQDNITLKDSRNILRKGAIEGYAEVDFVALNGDKYRSRWMVRRARNRADGALQSTSIKLDNLSTSFEEQGTKKDLLNRIAEIIGLTFNQFTRAVLLAQGDFATFLKAKQNEKAELLEKLTGTEIYSKISSLIYEKTGVAKNALEMLKQRIADVKLLNDDELDAFNLEKEKLIKEIEPLRYQLLTIEKKIRWIKDEEQLKKEIIQADNELKVTQTKIQEAATRYGYMAMIDLSQEIRDTYLDLESRRKQQITLNNNQQSKEKELKLVQERWEKTEADLKTAKTQLEELEQKYTNLKPDIVKARELDIQIRTTRERTEQVKKELDLQQESLKTSEQNILSLQTHLKDIQQNKAALEKWFESNNHYKETISRIDLVTTLLNNALTSKKQCENATKSLEAGQEMLQTLTKQLEQQEEEAERLNTLLPTEIINLREKLEDGKPCPVCGSVHHPLSSFQEQESDIDEKELETAKKKIAETILKTKDNINSTQKNIIEFQVHINSFQSQYDNAYGDLKGYLSFLTDWENMFDQGVLQKELEGIASLWDSNKIKLDSNSQQMETLSVRIEAENKTLLTIKEELKNKTELFNEYIGILNRNTDERALLLKGKSVEDIENRYVVLREDYSKVYEQQRQARESLESQKASINGTITQLRIDAKTNSEQINKLVVDVQEWINGNHQISEEMLKDLMSRSREWINQEKNYLTEIKNQELVLSTTLKERNARLRKHQESEDKPNVDESKEHLELHFNEIGDKQETINKRLTEIQVALTTHEQGKERIKSFESELRTKDELYTNWAKLNDLLGSATGNKFKTIAQGYTLDVLLGYANKHLEELSRRYKLEKIPNTLALQVIDNDMLGEVRTVHSLSGGESFLISLSLALGLSSLSSNRMKIESLFIDEGFGSLDIDTFSVAMDALENLQTQGRKIGVISHVEEMKERITAQIQVIKAANGRSTIKVVG